MSRSLMAFVAVVGCACAAQAQYSTGFEAPTYTGTPGGTSVNGQDGWYTPAVAGSQDGTVNTYIGNTYGFVGNPTGGSQFLVTRFGNANPARAQHTIDFSAGDIYTASFDFCGDRFGGTLPASNNLGSFSLQNSATARFFQSLYVWDDLATGNAMDANYIFFNAAGVQNGASGITPGPAWDALRLNTWYRSSTTWSFNTNQILSISIDNLHDANPATVMDVSALGWYLAGGANPTQPRPTDIRFFGSGAGDDVNQMGWDNLQIVPAPGSLALLGAAGLVGARRRRR
jgi:hypothetical protein